MATEIQYQIYKAVYDEEAARYSALENRSKLYLTIITFYLGAITFKINDVLEFVSKFNVRKWLYLASGFILVVALLLTVLATRIRKYEGICDLEEVYQSNEGETDEDFLENRLTDLAVATNRNSDENNKVATLLQWAS